MCHGWVGVRRKEETDSGEGSPEGLQEEKRLSIYVNF